VKQDGLKVEVLGVGVLLSNSGKFSYWILASIRYFRVEDFETDLENSLHTTNYVNYQLFHSVTETVLQKHAPLKQRVIRGNNKPQLKSDLRKAIMTRTRLKDRATKSGSEEDYKKYERQRNVIVGMNRKAKPDFYHSVDVNTIENDKKFGRAVFEMVTQ